MILKELAPHAGREHFEIPAGDLALLLPIKRADAAAALAAMLETTHLTAQFVKIQRNHLFRARLREGRLAARQAVFPTPEVHIRQPDGTRRGVDTASPLVASVE